MYFARTAPILFALALPTTSFAQPPRSIELPVTTTAVRIDGHIHHDEWRDAGFATDFTQQRPRHGAPASFSTVARIARDDRAIYVAARLDDPYPDSIVARLARRDGAVDSDWFWVFFDTFGDDRSAFAFAINPAGVRRDLRITGDTREDPAWDAVWDAAASIDDRGWTVEMRIPLSQLRYPAGDDAPAWGINFRREIARRGEVALWSNAPEGAARFVSAFGSLSFDFPLPARSDLQLVPYVVTSARRSPGHPADPWHGHTITNAAFGADLDLAIGHGLTLAATVNPDFGQVEADPSQLNLSSFEAFLPERRPFFVEGANAFDIAGPSFPRIFHSRRIGRAVQGATPGDARHAEPAGNARIIAAAKVTGTTASGWTVGLLDAVTAKEERAFIDQEGATASTTVEPLTNYAVARVARASADGRTTIGGMLTSTIRDIDDATLRHLHTSAHTGAIDFSHRTTSADLEITGSINGSYVRGDTLAIQRTQRAPGRRFDRHDAHHLRYDPRRTSLSGAGASLAIRSIGSSPWHFSLESFARSPGLELNDLGFQFSDGADAWGGFASLQYRRLRPAGPFRRWSLGAWGSSSATFGGESWGRSAGLTFDAQFDNLWSMLVDVGRTIPALSVEALRGGPAIRTDGATGLYARFASDPRGTIVASADLFAEVRPDAATPTWSINPTISIRPSTATSFVLSASAARSTSPNHFITRADADHVVARLDQRTWSATLRAEHNFSPDISLQLWLQPFAATARFDDYRTVADPRAHDRADRYTPLDAGRLDALNLTSPDFAVRELRSNLVLRWEYLPGSTAFLVWGHERDSFDDDALAGPGRALDRLLHTPATNRLMLKLDYRLGS